MPLCPPHSLQRFCFEQIIFGLRSDQYQHCKKSCFVEEYKIRDETDWHATHDVNGFKLAYKFGLPDATKIIRSERPFKKVSQEYLLITELSLIGILGGALGMFIGFSFVGTSDWVMEYISKLCTKISDRKKKRSPLPLHINS